MLYISRRVLAFVEEGATSSQQAVVIRKLSLLYGDSPLVRDSLPSYEKALQENHALLGRMAFKSRCSPYRLGDMCMWWHHTITTS